ncbi:MAG: NifU family protein [Planctomycetes bacterium]|nr:NifU family protein [Planctomycetota bacterium]
MKAQVQAALEEIRPYIQADGGDVELVSVEDGIVTIKMTGHCVGCPSSQVTLRQGIETHLRKRVPDLVEIVQAPDTQQVPSAHAPVTSPFAGGQGVSAAPAPDTVTTHLRDMHRKAEALLTKMETSVEAIVAGQGKPEHVKGIEEAIDFLTNELMTHMRQEDEVLFPALIPFISWGSPMSVMAKEHRIIHDEINDLATALKAYKDGGDAGGLARVAKRVSQRLRDDFYQEENVLFVEADESIVGSRAKALKEAMVRISAAATRDSEH